MVNLERKTVEDFYIVSLKGVSFFSGNIENKLLGTITDVSKDKKSGNVEICITYPSTGSSSRQPLESCKNYLLATQEEVEIARERFREYSE